MSMTNLSPRSIVEDDKEILDSYLARIGFEPAEAKELKAAKPNMSDLSRLLTAHFTSVPFENLGQHEHPASTKCAHVKRDMPTLQIEKTLQKIIFDKRGGFCWEINFAFAWLLRAHGYSVRIGNSHVITPGGPVPGHLVLFVDGLAESAILVDPGFGDTVRVPVPVEMGAQVSDAQLGDAYSLAKNDDPTKFGQSAEQASRFDTVLMRSRKVGIASSPMVAFFGMDAPPPAPEMTPPEPVLLLNAADDLPLDAPEFVEGLASVLTEHEANFFSQKRMALRLDAHGYTFVGQDYVKQVANGVEVSRTALDGEEAYRAALERHLGIVL